MKRTNDARHAQLETEPGATSACGKLFPDHVEKYLPTGQPPDDSRCARCDRTRLGRPSSRPTEWVRFGIATASGMSYRGWSLWHARTSK